MSAPIYRDLWKTSRNLYYFDGYNKVSHLCVVDPFAAPALLRNAASVLGLGGPKSTALDCAIEDQAHAINGLNEVSILDLVKSREIKGIGQIEFIKSQVNPIDLG